jgi:tetratricopeptide (TPR) repeat protein
MAMDYRGRTSRTLPPATRLKTRSNIEKSPEKQKAIAILHELFGLGMLLLALLASSVGGCAGRVPVSAPPAGQGTTAQSERPVVVPEKPGSRALASMQLTEQGRIFLENGQSENAISVLERAINLNPANGQNYYLMSEAWLQKGDLSQAAEFNRLAGLYLEENQAWMAKVEEQRSRINKRSR